MNDHSPLQAGGHPAAPLASLAAPSSPAPAAEGAVDVLASIRWLIAQDAAVSQPVATPGLGVAPPAAATPAVQDARPLRLLRDALIPPATPLRLIDRVGPEDDVPRTRLRLLEPASPDRPELATGGPDVPERAADRTNPLAPEAASPDGVSGLPAGPAPSPLRDHAASTGTAVPDRSLTTAEPEIGPPPPSPLLDLATHHTSKASTGDAKADPVPPSGAAGDTLACDDNLFGHAADSDPLLRSLVADAVRRELAGETGTRLSRQLRILIRNEVAQAIKGSQPGPMISG